MLRMTFKLWLLLLMALAMPSLSLAQSEPASEPTSSESAPSSLPKPATIYMGIYLHRIESLDLKAGSASVVYYIWTRWRSGDDLDGTLFELMSGSVESKDLEYRYEEMGYHYAYYRHRSTVKVEVDFHNFPFDEHSLNLDFEHSVLDMDDMVVAVDESALQYLESPELSGWVVGKPRYEIKTMLYKTSWGMPELAPDNINRAARFRASISLRHEVAVTFMKTFLLLFISMLISHLAFVIHPENLDARIGIGVAGIFGAVTSQSVVAGNLPEISYLTISDKVHIASLLFMFFSLLTSCLLGYLCRYEREALAIRINWISGLALTVAYIVLVFSFVYFR